MQADVCYAMREELEIDILSQVKCIAEAAFHSHQGLLEPKKLAFLGHKKLVFLECQNP